MSAPLSFVNEKAGNILRFLASYVLRAQLGSVAIGNHVLEKYGNCLCKSLPGEARLAPCVTALQAVVANVVELGRQAPRLDNTHRTRNVPERSATFDEDVNDIGHMVYVLGDNTVQNVAIKRVACSPYGRTELVVGQPMEGRNPRRRESGEDEVAQHQAARTEGP